MFRVVALVLGLGACGRIGFDPEGPTVDAADPLRAEAIVQVAVGGKTTCALRHDGGVWCWGYGAGGRLGDGSVGVDAPLPQPTTIDHGAVELYANDAGLCARLDDGSVVCWGDNSEGAFGVGDTGLHAIPTPVLGLANPTSFALTTDASCSLVAGTVSCAGYAHLLGTGDLVDRATLAPVPGLAGVQQLTGGNFFVCALLMDGSTRCWGDNAKGQLGIAPSNTQLMPVAGPVGPYTQITAGDEFACGVTMGKTLECWGANQLHQLGNDAIPDGGTGPVLGLTDVSFVEAAAAGACAIRGDRSVWCWGQNVYGQLADGAVADRAEPQPTLLATPTVQLASRTDVHACVLDDAHVVRCWGSNSSGSLGIGTRDDADHGTPTLVLGLP